MNWRNTASNGKERYWQSRELIVIGTFAALTKVSTMLIALAGGGMNPVSLVLKNMVATSLLIVLVYKVRKFGVLTLFVLVNTVVSLLLMGGSMMTIPGLLVASVLCDGLIIGLGGYRKAWALMSGVAAFDLLSRVVSLGYAYLTAREEPRFFIMGVIVVSLGYVGCLAGLGTGVYFMKELRHAGIIRQ